MTVKELKVSITENYYQMMMQQNTAPLILTQKYKQLLIKATFVMYLNQSILRLYQTSFFKVLQSYTD